MSKRYLGLAGAVAIAAAGVIAQQTTGSQAGAPQAKVIEVTAKKYDYTPSEIRVKKGERVQLKVRATDKTHGFEFLFPAGTAPGLKVEQTNYKLQRDQERVIEFVAEQAGTYPFKCSVFCGFGHRGMRGTAIVEE